MLYIGCVGCKALDVSVGRNKCWSTWTWTWTWSTHLAHVLVPSKLSAAVDHQPDKLGEGELERRSFLGRLVEPLPHPGKWNSALNGLKSQKGAFADLE